jgi:hypothetical protein
MRRHQLVRMAAIEGLAYGYRVRWAKRLGVSPATITADLNIILRQHPQDIRGGRPINRQGITDEAQVGTQLWLHE